MWRFGKGVKPSAKKQRTNEEMRTQQKAYDETKTETVLVAWLTKFNWLGYKLVAVKGKKEDNNVPHDMTQDRQRTSSPSTNENQMSGMFYKMFCKSCTKYEKAGIFVTGSTSF